VICRYERRLPWDYQKKPNRTVKWQVAAVKEEYHRVWQPAVMFIIQRGQNISRADRYIHQSCVGRFDIPGDERMLGTKAENATLKRKMMR